MEFLDVWSISQQQKTDLRMAAYLLAVSRVANAVKKTRPDRY
jgi:glutamate dehydrogenase/leucine dehydrogenase